MARGVNFDKEGRWRKNRIAFADPLKHFASNTRPVFKEERQSYIGTYMIKYAHRAEKASLDHLSRVRSADIWY